MPPVRISSSFPNAASRNSCFIPIFSAPNSLTDTSLGTTWADCPMDSSIPSSLLASDPAREEGGLAFRFPRRNIHGDSPLFPPTTLPWCGQFRFARFPVTALFLGPSPLPFSLGSSMAGIPIFLVSNVGSPLLLHPNPRYPRSLLLRYLLHPHLVKTRTVRSGLLLHRQCRTGRPFSPESRFPSPNSALLALTHLRFRPWLSALRLCSTRAEVFPRALS